MTKKEYKSLFDEFYASQRLLANKYLENMDVAKDVVQDVFIKIWEDKIEFQNINEAKAYLYTSVKNKSLDYLKSKRYKSIDFLSARKLEKIETESFFLREVVVIEVSTIVEKAINELPDKCANIIRLSLKEYTVSQIADELGLSINTVKTQKKIAYKKLRPLLEEYYFLFFFLLKFFK
ncbi:sigma-70 family RNA polymerase sigma factor [Flavobacterium sp. MAHUQ-51]|uniref:sigma-70 family RNA polymerase sigma factor n=1 Tax=Flavobacterium sp. GCM10022190 TaxID=3252639 RepID=UPI003616095A